MSGRAVKPRCGAMYECSSVRTRCPSMGSYVDWPRLAGAPRGGVGGSHDPLWTGGQTVIGITVKPHRLSPIEID
jgi:hypothetical protein